VSADPSRVIPVPGCQPGLAITDWRSCGYVAQQSQDGSLCIPLAACSYLRACFSGGASSGWIYRGAAGLSPFSCTHASGEWTTSCGG
jgi:hypothetical protein